MRALVATAMLVALAGCVSSAEQLSREAAVDARAAERLERRLAGYVAGTPQACIQPFRANSSVYDNTIVYDAGGRLYRTDTGGGCFGLRRDDIIVTRTIGTQLCRGDLVRTVDRTSGFQSGACSFGDFIPYTRTRR
jgi:hypothetical protein